MKPFLPTGNKCQSIIQTANKIRTITEQQVGGITLRNTSNFAHLNKLLGHKAGTKLISTHTYTHTHTYIVHK